MSATMREMLEAGVHFGHQTRFWNPKMAPFIFGHRNKIHIINLEKSLPMLQEATKFARQISAKRGTILMVGTKRQARETVATEAQRAGVPFVDQRWLGGMLTNFKTVKTSIKRLKEMKVLQEAGLDSMSKKEQLMFARELSKLEKDIGGIQDMAAVPDAIFVIDVGYHKIAIAEAKKLGIPLIAYSPLALGLLARAPGQDAATPKGPRGSLFRRLKPGLGPLLDTMAGSAAGHGSDLAAVALNWCRAHGAMPIPGLRRPDQVDAVAAACRWQLSLAERQRLDQLVLTGPRMPMNPFQSR